MQKIAVNAKMHSYVEFVILDFTFQMDNALNVLINAM